jgi:chaperonin cofactor prefoldin
VGGTHDQQKSRKQKLHEFSAEQREQDRAWLQRRKIDLLLDHAAELCRIEEQRKRWRADLEEAKRAHTGAKAAAEDLEILRAVGRVTLH